MCGDCNARLGNKQDCILDIGNAPKRFILDKATNKHGDALYEFLLDCKRCIVNGQVTPEFNNWTSISTKGKSVVDCVIVPMECLDICATFKVLTARSIISEYCNIADVDLDLPDIVPDHSVIMLELNINKNNHSIVDSGVEYDQPVDFQQNVNSDNTEHVPPQYFTRFKVDKFLMISLGQRSP